MDTTTTISSLPTLTYRFASLLPHLCGMSGYSIAVTLSGDVVRPLLSSILLALPIAAFAAAPPTLDEPVTIPIQIVKGFPVLIARIADRDMPLLFDLGGYEHITLTQEAMRVGGVVPLHDGAHTWKDAKGNLIEAPRFTVKELRLGDAVFREVNGHVAEFDASFPTIPLGNAGHIGTALVRPYKVLLDYGGGTMTLIPGDYDDARAGNAGCRGAVVPFAPGFEDEPVSRVKTDLGTLTFVWDTGASTSVIRRDLVAAPAAESPRRIPSAARTSSWAASTSGRSTCVSSTSPSPRVSTASSVPTSTRRTSFASTFPGEGFSFADERGTRIRPPVVLGGRQRGRVRPAPVATCSIRTGRRHGVRGSGGCRRRARDPQQAWHRAHR